MADEIRSDNGVVTRQQGYRLLPGLGASCDPVNEQDGRAVARPAEAQVMAVDGNALKFGQCRRRFDLFI